jgi:predicted DNA-binding transcriptional regulator AlpA
VEQEPITITIGEAIRLSSLGRSYIYEKMSDGSFKSVKASKRRLILYSSFKDWLTSLPSAK